MSLGDIGRVRRTLLLNLDGEFGQHWRGKSRKGGKMKPEQSYIADLASLPEK